MKYKTTATVTLRQQNGGDAGKVQSGFVFESNTSRMIRDALHRKIEDGAKLGLYVPASVCVEYEVEPAQVTLIRISESYDGGKTFPVSKYYEEVPKP